MKTRFILAGLAGGVLCFFLGWLVYGILLMDFYNANTIHYDGLTKEMPVMWLLVLSNLITGYFIAFVFHYWAKISTLKGGLIGGMIIGAFWIAAYDTSFLSMWNLYYVKTVVVDILVGIVFYGIIGAVEGWILCTGKKDAT